MFTGLVETTARVRRVDPDGDGVRLEVETPLAAELSQGDSIAVNGVCLTAVDPGAAGFKADGMAETLRRSSLGPPAARGSGNAEPPLRAGDRLRRHARPGPPAAHAPRGT